MLSYTSAVANIPAVSVQVAHMIPASVAMMRGLSSSPMAVCVEYLL